MDAQGHANEMHSLTNIQVFTIGHSTRPRKSSSPCSQPTGSPFLLTGIFSRHKPLVFAHG